MFGSVVQFQNLDTCCRRAFLSMILHSSQKRGLKAPFKVTIGKRVSLDPGSGFVNFH